MSKIVITVTNDIIYDQRMLKIAGSLSDFGHSVTIIGRAKKSEYNTGNMDISTHWINCIWNKGVLFYLEYNLRLWLYCRKLNYDWHYSVDVDTLLAAYILGKKTKLAYDSHEYFDKTPELIAKPIKQFIWRRLEAHVIRRVKVAMTVNDSLASIFERKYNIPYVVIKNVPYQNPLSELRQQSKSKIILYQGALNMGRGLECAIECLKLLSDDFILWFAGNGDIEQKLKSMVDKLDLEDRVHFLGMMDPTELKEVSKNAWIGLNLLDDRSESYYYSLANKFFDYMHSAVPSINMDFPEYRTILEQYECGLRLKKLDPYELSKIINNLADDPKSYKQMCDQCLQAAKVYNWENEEKKLKALFY